jgi:ribosomal protein L19E
MEMEGAYTQHAPALIGANEEDRARGQEMEMECPRETEDEGGQEGSRTGKIKRRKERKREWMKRSRKVK